jgi:enoyl-CoA hydratase/carnithine racemase
MKKVLRIFSINSIKKYYSTFSSIKYEKKNNIALITLNRPNALNALNKELCTELGKAITEIENNNEIKVTIITGEGPKAFAAGADIKEMSTKSFL